MAKGSAFERSICKRLSLWWTNGKDEDCFWRTSMSGGRATVRGRKGKRTRGQAGDICATGGRGRLLIKQITFELKRGYNRTTIHELIDKPKKAKPQTLEQWVEQAEASKKLAGTPWWLIIHKRDLREEVVYFPRGLWIAVYYETKTPPKPPPFTECRFKLLGEYAGTLCCTTLTNFLEHVDPKYFKGEK